MRKYVMLLLLAAASTFVVSAPAQAAESNQNQNPTPKPDYKVHKVMSGESLSSIAQDNQLDSWVPIWNVNESVQNPDLINPDQELKIPDPGQNTPERVLPQNQAPVGYVKPANKGTIKKNAPVYGGTIDGAWAAIRNCESGGNYAANTGNGYYGAYQYNLGTWNNYGGYARPDLAPPAVQDAKAQQTQAARGWKPWPACSARLGLR